MTTVLHRSLNAIFVGLAVRAVINSTKKSNATRSHYATHVGITKSCLKVKIQNAILANGFLVGHTKISLP